MSYAQIHLGETKAIIEKIDVQAVEKIADLITQIKAAREKGIELNRSFMVGDRASDIEAGHSCGCRSIFVDYGYSEPKPKNPDFTCRNLAEAVDWIQKTGAKD